LLIHSGAIPRKGLERYAGVAAMTLKKNVILESVRLFSETKLETRTASARGISPPRLQLPKEGDTFQQISSDKRILFPINERSCFPWVLFSDSGCYRASDIAADF
jgi:hypothetical protein